MLAEPTTVAAYLASMAISHAGATLRRRLAAIGRAHRMKRAAWEAKHPAIQNALAGIHYRNRQDPAAGRHLRQQPDRPA